ncbi:hypothetical protein [Halanaeroarchaeum sulfurireducens]|uniref:Uncharacterized protein n=1 Tax=Halanaeroarchaeum sulfurireducens TaxID=1604004 RepID=A0A0F7PBN2_9EURY|nr:hypothetical protein [Halanaeroarchaeum sulfurireducens]AKH97054.1 hypothetical protein HLASF_0557 [Halanaeroarchaeum sulfurireducens]ALG81455.1 hypothetical protein HLASA_0554 [Halanaeroarchaeum sulfurireducens]
MRKPSVKCALLAAMIAKHRWGTPIGEEALLAVTAIDPNDYPKARDAVEELRSATYIESAGKRGISLDNSAFRELADILYYDCDWEPFEIRSRLKHYEGWETHEWT